MTAPRHARIVRWLHVVLCCCMFSFLSVKVGAQVPQDSNTPPAEQILASYEGQPVTTVDIAGRPDLKVSQFTSELVNSPASPSTSKRSTARQPPLKPLANSRMCASRWNRKTKDSASCS